MKKERGIGIVLMLVGIIVIFLTSQIKLTGIVSSGDIGSKFFPYLVSICLIICGVGITISAKKDLDTEPFMDKDGYKRVGLMLLILLGYVIMLNYLGFLISSPILLYLMSTLLAGKSKIRLFPKILFSALMTLLIYILFVKVLSILLPTGILFS